MSALQRPHILIVSDDRDLSDFLVEGLVYAGFWTSVIADAMQTLEVFRLRTFDALLLDAALGGIGAFELLRRLRGHSDRGPATARTDIPILLLAGSAQEIGSRHGELSGVESVLFAPIELEELAAEIRSAVGSWRADHPDKPWADETSTQIS